MHVSHTEQLETPLLCRPTQYILTNLYNSNLIHVQELQNGTTIPMLHAAPIDNHVQVCHNILLAIVDFNVRNQASMAVTENNLVFLPAP